MMIIAGAISAARAKSTMTAVLSLGVSGYGMALTFLFFGAPDLAMTQFSVETLTAVIFVLVFYHFRGFGELSATGVRARDTSRSGFIRRLDRDPCCSSSAHPSPQCVWPAISLKWAAPRSRPQYRQRDIGRFSSSRHPRRDYGSGHGGPGGPGRSATWTRGQKLMTSLILRIATRVLMPLLLLYGMFLLLRGHNAPGGGFAGGLVVAAAYALHSFAFGVIAARRALLVDPSRLIGTGLLFALGSGLLPLCLENPFLHRCGSIPAMGIGTPTLFDPGVFLVVIGVVTTMTFTLVEE